MQTVAPVTAAITVKIWKRNDTRRVGNTTKKDFVILVAART